MSELHDDSLSQDLATIVVDKFGRGAIDRRSLLQALSALGLAGAADLSLPAKTWAAPGQLVLANFGGPEVAAFKQAYGVPFEKATGLKLVIDDSGPRQALVRAAVQAHAVAWDVTDSATIATLSLGEGGFIEPIDYTIVDKDKVMPGFALPWGVANYTYSYILAYDTQRFPQPPQNWVDFWDRKKFPGMRTMSKTPSGQLEAAALAGGVPRDKLYPLDLDLAVKKIKEIKDDVIFWENAQQCMQLFRDREVVMGDIWHHRAIPLLAELKTGFDFTWNDGIFCASAWNIPKGNPSGVGPAMKFVASTQDPSQQVELFTLIGSGPSNPAAHAMIPDALRHLDPGAPENFKAQITSDARWWADNINKATDMWLDAISA